MNRYDVMMIFLPSLKEDRVEQVIEGVSEEIRRLGGEPGAAKGLGKRVFGRPIKKRTEGRYCRLEFMLPAGEVDALKARLKLNQDVFRCQISRLPESAAGTDTQEEATTDKGAVEPGEDENGKS